MKVKLTEELRVLVRADLERKLEQCGECGRGPKAKSIRELARQMDVNHTTLFRFMKGKTTSSELIDALYLRYFGSATIAKAREQ